MKRRRPEPRLFLVYEHGTQNVHTIRGDRFKVETATLRFFLGWECVAHFRSEAWSAVYLPTETHPLVTKQSPATEVQP